jgi:hypothetical protein
LSPTVTSCRSSHRNRPNPDALDDLPEITHSRHAASDHAAIWVDLNL